MVKNNKKSKITSKLSKKDWNKLPKKVQKGLIELKKAQKDPKFIKACDEFIKLTT